ncbi:MAG: rhodanese-like domain-containing protein [Caldimicrobium sp.]
MKRPLGGFWGLMVSFFFILLFTKNAFATNYIEPEELKKWLTSGKGVILVDIQPHDDFIKGHIKGAIETNAFPANNDDLRKRLDKVLPIIQKSTNPVVIICPRGRSGAKNSYDYLLSKGVPESRLFILKGGMAEWPFPELLEKGK